MFYVHASVYTEKSELYVTLTYVYPKGQSLPEVKSHLTIHPMPSYADIIKVMSHDDTPLGFDYPGASLLIQKSKPVKFSAYTTSNDEMECFVKDNKIFWNSHDTDFYYYVSEKYHVSDNHDVAINFLLLINFYVRRHNPMAVSESEFSKLIDNGLFDDGLKDFFSPGDIDLDSDQNNPDLSRVYEYDNKFLTVFLDMKLIPRKYRRIYDSLKLLTGYCLLHQTAYLESTSGLELRQRLLAHKSLYRLILPSVPLLVKIQIYCSVAKELMDRDKTREFVAEIDNVNKLAKFILYKKILGKSDGHKSKYTRNHVMWNFLRNARFEINPDGRMSITDLHDNQGYLSCHANGVHKQYLFESEVKLLFICMGLEIASDTKFDEKIIFTPAATEILSSYGLHFNSGYLAKLQRQSMVSSSALFHLKELDENNVHEGKREIASESQSCGI